MQPVGILFVMMATTAFAQLPNFFGGFANFPSFGEAFGQQQQQVPTAGNGRSSTGTTSRPGGPVLFPPSPESRDTSGVVVGASGYGFIPPGVREITQGRANLGRIPTSFSSSFSQPSSFPSSSDNFFDNL